MCSVHSPPPPPLTVTARYLTEHMSHITACTHRLLCELPVCYNSASRPGNVKIRPGLGEKKLNNKRRWSNSPHIVEIEEKIPSIFLNRTSGLRTIFCPTFWPLLNKYGRNCGKLATSQNPSQLPPQGLICRVGCLNSQLLSFQWREF